MTTVEAAFHGAPDKKIGERAKTGKLADTYGWA